MRSRRSRCVRGVGAAGVAVVVAALVASCSGPRADPADLGPSTPPSSTSAPTPAGTYTPSLAPGTTLPTVGTPTVAVAELRGAGALDPAVLSTWKRYQEELSESLRAHRPTGGLRALAGRKIIQRVEDRGPDDAEDGLTVSLRPLGRLQSSRGSDGTTEMRTCMWAPSVGFFVEADGREVEGGEPGWVQYATTLTRSGQGWTVSDDDRTGRTCPGGAP